MGVFVHEYPLTVADSEGLALEGQSNMIPPLPRAPAVPIYRLVTRDGLPEGGMESLSATSKNNNHYMLSLSSVSTFSVKNSSILARTPNQLSQIF